MTITQAQLKELLHYNPDTGVFTWIANGNEAGRKAAKYIGITVNKKPYLAHRLAWLYTYGEWPEQDTDHINGNKKDNRIANLRKASRSENMRNAPARKSNTSGIKGVSWDKTYDCWVVRITVNKRIIQKYVRTGLADAAATAISMRNNLHGQFANHG